MALKKSQLYSSLWQSCDELRGGMDASQYKDYVLTLLFMKYVSDKYAGQPDALIVVPDGGGFADMVKLKGDKEIGDRINTIIGRLADRRELRLRRSTYVDVRVEHIKASSQIVLSEKLNGTSTNGMGLRRFDGWSSSGTRRTTSWSC